MFTKNSVKVLAAVSAGFLGGTYFDTWRSRHIVKAAGLLPTPGPPNIPAEPPPSCNRATQIMRFGYPGMDTVKFLGDYVLSYDRRNKTAHWVFEHLTWDSLKHNDKVDRARCEFVEDNSIHPYFRSLNSDYKGSGFDRGHLAAAGNHRKSQEEVQETFFLSNMSPQTGKGFNRDSWNKLEKHVRHMTKRYRNVYVCTGPLYLPRAEADGKLYVKYQVIGSNHVAVPTHFFKAVVGETDSYEYDLEVYVMPNTIIDDNTPLAAFLVPIDTVERAAGLLLFDKIPRNAFRKINGKPASQVLQCLN